MTLWNGRARGELDELKGGQSLRANLVLHEVLKLTAEIFPGTITTELDCDPEDPGVENLVIRVGAQPADGLSVLDQEILWCQRVAETAPEDAARLRLVVTLL